MIDDRNDANGINALPRTPGAYLIRNVRTGRCYVGKTPNLRRRCRQHFGDIKRGRHPNMKIQRDATVHGLESFRFIALGTVATAREASNLEAHFRQLLGTADPDTGYDLVENRCYTKECRLRMVEKRLSEVYPPKYFLLPGVSLHDPYNRILLDTWEPNPPGMRY